MGSVHAWAYSSSRLSVTRCDTDSVFMVLGVAISLRCHLGPHLVRALGGPHLVKAPILSCVWAPNSDWPRSELGHTFARRESQVQAVAPLISANEQSRNPTEKRSSDRPQLARPAW